MYRISLFHSKPRNSNEEINNNQNVVTERMPQDSTVHSISSNYSESLQKFGAGNKGISCSTSTEKSEIGGEGDFKLIVESKGIPN